MAYKVVQDESEAVKILHEIMQTPQLRSVHFTFDVGVGFGPIVRYEVERFAFCEEQEK